MKKRLPFFREKIASNWLYKLVAFFVALAIWITTIQGRKDTILVRNMDLEFLLKPNLVVTNLDDRSIRVKVSGPRTSLSKFRQSTQTITLNLTQEVAGLKRIEIKPSDINLPIGVKLISIQPDSFDIEIKDIQK
jgi:hypothetical protein